MNRAASLFACAVLMIGALSAPAFDLTIDCSASKTAYCTSAWAFDDPVYSSTCPTGGGYVDLQPFVTVTNGTCPKVVTRTWTVTDYCGNTNSCSQSVTLLDANPPAALCSGINLVPNPSFENYSLCPAFLGQVDKAYPWYPPTQGTSDYFNDCTTNSLIDVPINFAGTQATVSGQAYMGAIVFRDTGNGPLTSYREYLQAPLIAPLASGMTYRLTFHVSRAEQSPAAVADIGAHFSSAPVVLPGDNYVLPVTPQVVNPATNILMSTTNWMLIEGTFTATGGESYITVGSFQSDAASTVTLTTNIDEYTYYYFDEVSLVAECPSSATGKTVNCISPWNFDEPLAVDPCSGTDVTVSVAATVTNQSCPLITTRTWTLTDLCGNTSSWSQTIFVTNNIPPQIICECVADSEIPALNTNSCAGVVPDLSGYNNCVINPCGSITWTQQPPAGTVFGPGSHSITLQVQNCEGLISICQIPFNVYPPVPVMALPTNLVVLTCSNSLPVNYLVSASGNSGAIACTPPSGSVFTQGVTTVTCIATSACGGVASNTFTVTVKPPRARWFCNLVGVGVGVGHGTFGGATTAARTGGGTDYPALVVYPESGVATNSGVTLKPGPADAFTFSMVLLYPADAGDGFDLHAPPHAMNTNGLPLLSVRANSAGTYMVRAWPKHADDTSGSFRAIAVATNGNLLDSITYPATAAATNPVISIPALPGVTSCHITVTYNLATGQIDIGYPGTLDVSATRKGWDGCIYGPDRPVKKPHARVIITPPVATNQEPTEELSMTFSGWPQMTVEEPKIETQGRKWSDGHVTLMKAYDDGEPGVEFLAAGPGGGVTVDLGFASNMMFNVRHMQDSAVTNQEQTLRFTGGPGVVNLQISLSKDDALGAVSIGSDFTPWGASNVTLQLWDGGALVNEAVHVPSTSSPLVVIDRFPSRMGMPDTGTVSLSDTNPLLVASGLDCGGGLPCVGTELRIVGEFDPLTPPPAALVEMEFLASEDMDQQLYDVQSAPACVVVPVQSARTTNGVVVTWNGDGFQLQGGESAAGPWYSLGATSPVVLSAGSPLRVFRLRCE